MKQGLQIKFGQQLTMTPQLQQAIRLLQLSTADLQQEIQEMLDSNPMLEVEGDDVNDLDSGLESESDVELDLFSSDVSSDQLSVSEQIESQEIPEEIPMDNMEWDDLYQTTTPVSSAVASGNTAGNGEGFDFTERTSTAETLQDYMLWQLNLTPMSDRDRIIALAFIDALEPSGMLNQTVEDVYAGLKNKIEDHELFQSIEQNREDGDELLALDEVTAVLHRIQQFDPPGIAAQNLQECLMIQLNQLHEDTPWLLDAKLVVNEYLNLLAAHDYKQLMRRSSIRENTLRETIKLIQSLNPVPGATIDTSTVEYVVPDVYVEKIKGRWQVKLNSDIAPKLKINSQYASFAKRENNKEDTAFLRDNLQEARWFLKSLENRNDTLLKVATAIVEYQHNFFEYGEEAMKPLVLHEIAEVVSMHESTISRVTTQKYMHTPAGVFELKYFFSSHVATAGGGECSSTAIRALIKKLVAAENTQKPLSDNKISQLLDEQGVRVARRTIAKYREALNIPPSNERKRLC